MCRGCAGSRRPVLAAKDSARLGAVGAAAVSRLKKKKKKIQPLTPQPWSPPPLFPAGSGTAGSERRGRLQPLNAAFVFVCSRFFQEARGLHPFKCLSPSTSLCKNPANQFRKHLGLLFLTCSLIWGFLFIFFFLKGNLLKFLLFAKNNDTGDRKHATKKLNLYKTFPWRASFGFWAPLCCF